ncbi:hypothetical protein HN51_070055 [Arachis hypogaea]
MILNKFLFTTLIFYGTNLPLIVQEYVELNMPKSTEEHSFADIITSWLFVSMGIFGRIMKS